MTDLWKEAFEKIDEIRKDEVEQIEAIYEKDIYRLEARLTAHAATVADRDAYKAQMEEVQKILDVDMFSSKPIFAHVADLKSERDELRDKVATLEMLLGKEISVHEEIIIASNRERNELKAMLTEATQWRDISTAPRDGTLVRVFFKGEEYKAVWYEELQEEFFYADEGWYTEAPEECGQFLKPTHWLPLPAASKESPDGKA